MRPDLEVADVFHRHGADYRRDHAGHLGRVERRVMAAVEACRTAALGGHAEHCTDCGLVRQAYNSCRNRHCPKCQGLARAQWLAERQAELLPVPYFHVVFTLPAQIAEIAFQNKAAVYTILFKAASEALRVAAADPRHLGAAIGVVAVLHTWGQNLHHHPHIHCIVPGGGLSLDGQRWVACRPGFFLPVRVLSRLFRRLFLKGLQNAFEAGQLRFFSDLAGLADPTAFSTHLAKLKRIEWVVFAKPPFGGPEQVLAYLGRYTHRVAIANSRLVGLDQGKVSFRWKDYRHHEKPKHMTLSADEFIRRFLLHALPDGFHRIRHFQGVLGLNGMLATPIVDGSGVADALAGMVGGEALIHSLLVMLMILALVLCIMTAMAGSSRTLYQGSVDGWLPRYLSHVNEHGAPTRAMWTDLCFNLIVLAIASADATSFFFILAVSNCGYIIFHFLNLNSGNGSIASTTAISSGHGGHRPG